MNSNKLLSVLFIALFFFTGSVFAGNISVTTDITSNTTWTNDNIYIMYGDIVVKNGATLTIQAGTLIKGDKTTGGRLIVATGAKLVARGTAEQPIVFTSNLAPGSRSRGDWSGIAICGLAPVNFKDGGGNPIQGRIECGTTTDYDFGGNIPDDSSGVLTYVRIEYAGYVCGSNTELNSLTLGGVGSRTVIDHVLCSYGQDDGYEFFGGTVNASHIVSFGSRDDDFDTDNGYSGHVQHGLIIRVDTIADQGDISNAFESDNDANGTYNDPYTKAVFSNITVVGPAETTTSTIDAKYGWGARIRRNSGLNIFNSVFIGYKRGLRLEGAQTQLKASTDTLEFKNNIIAGCVEQYYESAFDSLYLLAQTSNTIVGGNANDAVKLGSPYGNPANYNFMPQATSLALSGADFTNAKLSSFTPTTYRGAFGTENWLNCWSNFTPQTTDYTTSPINYAPQVTITQSGDTSAGFTLTANNINGATYAWSTGDNTAVTTVNSVGTYTLTVTDSKGCVATKTYDIALGVNNELTTISAINLFPNPNSGNASLQVTTSEAFVGTVSIKDVTGRMLFYQNQQFNQGVSTVSLNTESLSSGVYFVVINSGTAQKTTRMFIAK